MHKLWGNRNFLQCALGLLLGLATRLGDLGSPHYILHSPLGGKLLHSTTREIEDWSLVAFGGFDGLLPGPHRPHNAHNVPLARRHVRPSAPVDPGRSRGTPG